MIVVDSFIGLVSVDRGLVVRQRSQISISETPLRELPSPWWVKTTRILEVEKAGKVAVLIMLPVGWAGSLTCFGMALLIGN
jgi:hypothetical protein